MKFLLMPNINKENALSCCNAMAERLCGLGGEVWTCERYRPDLGSTFYRYGEDFFSLLSACDLLIVVGGDGTIIHYAKHAKQYGKRVLGVNVGRLGFVAGMEPDQMELLPGLFTGDYLIEKRMLLSVRILGGAREEKEYLALNDAVISNTSISRMVELHVSYNQKPIAEYRADGLIAATPTGSTAYTLSAGGPVIDPSIFSLLLTPICPHSLFSRTIVFAPDACLTIHEYPHNREKICLTLDGEKSIPLEKGEYLSVGKAAGEVEMINLKKQAFCEVFNEKIIERRFHR